MTMFTRGDHHDALLWANRTKEWVTEHCADSGWLLAEAEVSSCAQNVAMVEIAALRGTIESAMQRLKVSGNEIQLAWMTALRSSVVLADDEPEATLAELDEVLRAWPRSAAALIVMWSMVNALLYQGHSAEALRVLKEHLPKFTRFGYQRTNPWRFALPMLEAQVELACARDGLGARHARACE